MKPYNKIYVMDVYKNPMTNSEWLVVEKNDEENLILVTMLCDLPERLNKPFWKKNTDRMFNYRLVQDGSRYV